MKNPFKELKDIAVTEAQQRIQEQQQRKERLQELEELQAKNKATRFRNPIKTAKINKEIKQVEKEIEAAKDKNRTAIMLIVLGCVIILCVVLGFFGEDSENKDESVSQTTVEQSNTETTDTQQNTEAVHTHTYTEATCAKPKTCSVCGETEGEPIEHTWEEATCKSPEKCNVCGEIRGEKLEHKFVYGICKVCGEEDPDYGYELKVWIPTNGGTKYHSRPNCSNMDNPKEVTISEAKSRGFAPCQRCQ